MKSPFYLALLSLCIACSPDPAQESSKPEGGYLIFLDEYIVAHELSIDSTWVGGLSGIDNLGDDYAIISDDAARYQDPRYYKASIEINNGLIDSILFKEVIFLTDENGLGYADIKSARNQYVDPEAIRVTGDTIYWGSEGFRMQRHFDPTILVHNLQGKHLRTYATDPKFSTAIKEVGPRHNASFEGLALEPDRKALWVNVEMPLIQDGDVPSAQSGGAPIRISKINVSSGEIEREFGYQLAPLFVVPDSGAFAMNGAVELLWLAEGQVLVLERSYVAGAGNRVRLFRADYGAATDTKAMTSLRNNSIRPARKTLLLDFDDLPVEKIDNIEGLSWGPTLPNGNRTLIFVADNNFSKSQINQFLLLEVLRPLTD
ncbi:MAG: esterase-like activity of phytase family protein [Cyclobacteriaceae bacterium]